MAVTAPTIWHCQSGGNANYGGGFDPNYGGSNYALTTTPTCNGITIVLTGTGTTASLSSSGYTGVTADQGNVCNVTSVTSGTATVGAYIITSATSTQWTFNQSIGTAGAVIVVYVGGSKASLTNLIATTTQLVAGNTIKRLGGETLSGTSTTFLTSPAIAGVRVVGSGSSWDDGVKPTLTISGSSNTLLAHSSSSATGWMYECFTFDGANQTSARGANVTAGAVTFQNCGFTQFPNNCVVNTAARVKALKCDFTSCTGVAFSGNSGYSYLKGCRWSGNSNIGLTISSSGRVVVRGCLFHDGSGTSSDHIRVDASTADVSIDGCTIDGAGRHGINFQGNAVEAAVTNCLITNSGAYGISTTATNPPAVVDNCAYYGNTSGETTGLDSTRVSGSVTLTGDPYSDRSSDDYRLNNTSGAGAACRAAGYPSALNSFATSRNIGAFDVAAGGGGSAGMLVHPGMSGGARG